MASQTRGQGSLVGLELGHYRIVEEIGAGGMGVVYRAHDEQLDREVAIKVLPPGTLTDESARKWFRKEARSLSKLNHPNVATVHHFGSKGDIDYLVMEYIPGHTLRDRIADGPLLSEDIVGLSTQIVEGLMAAHERGLIHCDLKPENLRITPEGRLKILDFGLAKFVRPLSDLTTTSHSQLFEIAGTLPYMSPEQVLGKKLDPCTDVFSFGVLLYEMATGTLPFRGNTPSAISDAILHDVPIPPLRVNPDLPTKLEEIINRALEKDRDLRYQSAADIRSELKRLQRDTESRRRGIPKGAKAESVTSVIPRDLASARRPRSRAILIYVAATVLVLAALIAAGLWWRTRARPEISSIAVLPFTNPNHDTEYLSDGLTEGVINALSQSPGLKVMARSTVFRYKSRGEDPQKIGSDLNVSAVLTGRLLQREDTLHVSMDLVNVADGSQLWGEQYERRLDDVASLQRDIARDIGSKLRMRLAKENAARERAHHNPDREAYELYLKARYFWNQRTPDSVKRSISLFRQAVEKDPEYALAWAGLADAYNVSPGYGIVKIPRESYVQARRAAERALALDDGLAEAHAALALSLIASDFDWKRGESEFRRALDLNPGNANAHYFYSIICLGPQGRLEEAVAELNKALDLDPLSLIMQKNLGRLYFWQREYERALNQIKKPLEVDPNFWGAKERLRDLYLARGMYREAIRQGTWSAQPEKDQQRRAALSRIPVNELSRGLWMLSVQFAREDEAAGLYPGTARLAISYAHLGDMDKAFDTLRRAIEERDEFVLFPKVSPMYDVMRSDPRFKEMLQLVKLE